MRFRTLINCNFLKTTRPGVCKTENFSQAKSFSFTYGPQDRVHVISFRKNVGLETPIVAINISAMQNVGHVHS